MADIGNIFGGLMQGVDAYSRGIRQNEQDEMRRQALAQVQAIKDVQVQQIQQNMAMQQEKAQRENYNRQAAGLIASGQLQGDIGAFGRTGEELQQKLGFDPYQTAAVQGMIAQEAKRKRDLVDYAQRQNIAAQINAKYASEGKPEPFVVVENNEGQQRWIREGQEIPAGFKVSSSTRGADLAFAVGPDGRGQYFPMTAVLPKGFSWSTPAAQSREAKAQRKEKRAAAQKKQTAGIVLEDIGMAKGQAGLLTTGFTGSILSNVPGTDAADLEKTLSSIKANIGFDRLQQMRENSPTGGALGQVSENENRLLQSVMGNLEQSQSQEQFVRNLDRLENVYLDTIHGQGNWTKTPKGKPIVLGQVVNGYRWIGGDPKDQRSWEKAND